jgi:hypothetical protein
MGGDFSAWDAIPVMGTDAAEPSPISTSNFVEVSMAHDGANVYVYSRFADWASLSITNNIFIDVDGDSETGFKLDGNMAIGADLLVQNSVVRSFSGTTPSKWAWTSLTPVGAGISGNMTQHSIPREVFGDSEELRVVFFGDEPSGSYDFAPDSGNTGDGDYFTYILPEYTPTCDDQIKNGEEEYPDCGGECDPCWLLSFALPEGTEITIDGEGDEWDSLEVPGWLKIDNTRDSETLDLFKERVAHDDTRVYFLNEYNGKFDDCSCEWKHATSVLDFPKKRFTRVEHHPAVFPVLPGWFGAPFLLSGGAFFEWSFPSSPPPPPPPHKLFSARGTPPRGFHGAPGWFGAALLVQGG